MKRINDSFWLITFELRNIDISVMWLAETEINKNWNSNQKYKTTYSK